MPTDFITFQLLHIFLYCLCYLSGFSTIISQPTASQFTKGHRKSVRENYPLQSLYMFSLH